MGSELHVTHHHITYHPCTHPCSIKVQSNVLRLCSLAGYPMILFAHSHRPEKARVQTYKFSFMQLTRDGSQSKLASSSIQFCPLCRSLWLLGMAPSVPCRAHASSLPHFHYCAADIKPHQWNPCTLSPVTKHAVGTQIPCVECRSGPRT